ncbi:MAG: recombinase family protein [Polyangiaceae bacterium]
MISKSQSAEILRLYHAEKWKVGTIARQLHVHHGTVRRVLRRAGVTLPSGRLKPSITDPYVPLIIETLAKYPGVPITQETDDGPTKTMMEAIFAAFDQYESDMNAYRTMAAMRQNAEDGYFNGSKAPFGFEVVKVDRGKNKRGKLVPSPEEIPTYNEALRIYVEGSGAKATARELNRRGLRHRGRRWRKDHILRLIDEDAAIGTYYWGKTDSRTGKRRDRGEWVPIDVEPIIDHGLFDLARRLRQERDPENSPGKTTSSPLLLSRLVQCGKCGSTYTLETSGKRRPITQDQYRYYNCRAFLREGKESCSGNRICVEVLERLVLDNIAEALFTPERCGTILEQLSEEAEDYKQRTRKRRKLLNRQVADITERIKRWESAFEEGVEELDVVLPRLRELRDKRGQLEREVADLVAAPQPPAPSLEAPETIRRFRDFLADVLIAADTHVTKSYLRFLVEKVEVHEAAINIVPRDSSAAALMASEKVSPGAERLLEGTVLTPGDGWLRVRRSLRTLSVNAFGTDSYLRTDPRRRSRCDSENLRRERWDRFAASHRPIVSPSPRGRVPSGHVERKRGVPAPAGL